MAAGTGGDGCAAKRTPKVAAVLISVAAGPPALNCKGAAALDSRKKESRLIRNSANSPSAQLMPMIEPSTATIIRRTFGNIRPRRRPAAIRQSLRAIGLNAMKLIHDREIVIGIALKSPQTSAALAKLTESPRKQHTKMNPARWRRVHARFALRPAGLCEGLRLLCVGANAVRRICLSGLGDYGRPRLGIIERASQRRPKAREP